MYDEIYQLVARSYLVKKEGFEDLPYPRTCDIREEDLRPELRNNIKVSVVGFEIAKQTERIISLCQK